MNDAEEFDELARKQGHWGGGYQAKRAMAAGKLQEPVREALKLALDDIAKIPTLTHGLLVKLADVEAVINEALAQPAQEPVACVMGTYGDMFVVGPLNSSVVLPVGMALYAGPA